MNHRTPIQTIIGSLLVLLSLSGGLAFGKHNKAEAPPFQYVGGTEALAAGCGGRLEVLKDNFAFSCESARVNIPFTSVNLMQFRPNLSKQVQRMNIAWKVEPQIGRVKDNGYLTIVYSEQNAVHALVLKVSSETMRPYLAEIELKTGKSVEVYRSYDEFE